MWVVLILSSTCLGAVQVALTSALSRCAHPLRAPASRINTLPFWGRAQRDKALVSAKLAANVNVLLLIFVIQSPRFFSIVLNAEMQIVYNVLRL